MPSLPLDDVQVLYSGIVSTVQNTAEEVVGKPPKRSTHHWVSARLEDLVQQCNAASIDTYRNATLTQDNDGGALSRGLQSL